MSKDWTGNSKTSFAQTGASAHSQTERQPHDYYATEPKCAEDLLKVLPELNDIWEPACGEGHLSKRMENLGKVVLSTDLINRGYGSGGVDFLKRVEPWNGDIVTNPPFKYAREFIEKSLNLIPNSRYVCMFLKLTFVEGQARKKFFADNPPKFIYVYSARQKCAINAEFETTGSSAVCYAWYIWQKGYQGETILRWL